MAAGEIIQGVRWLRDAAGKLVGYRNPVTDKDEDVLTAAQVAATQSLVSGDGSRPLGSQTTLPSSNSAYQAMVLNHASSTYQFAGADETDGVVWVVDTTGGILRQGSTSDAWATTAGVTWSGNKTLPTSPNAVLYTAVTKLIRFGAHVYLLGKDSVTNLYGIYRSDPKAGSTAFVWSAPLHQFLSTAATALYTVFSSGGGYLWLGEYGDPTGGPTVWRSSDGTTWTQIYTEVGQGTPQRHMHAIAHDPYSPGTVWMTLGDANAGREIMKSTNYGTTWAVFEANAAWQAVQISFSATHIYFGGDSARGHLFVVDRETGTKRWACAGLAKNQAVPGAAASTDTFYTNGYFGVCDPNTGEYYFSLQNDGAGGNTLGFFVVPWLGAAPVLIEKPVNTGTPVDIFAGFVWCGKARRPLHSIA